MTSMFQYAIDGIPIANTVLLFFVLLSKSDKGVKLGIFTITLFQCLYFIHYELFNSATVVGMTAIRSICAIYWKTWLMGMTFLVATLLVPITIGDSDYWGVVAGLIGVFAFFFLSGHQMRIALGFGSLCWYLNNLTNQLYLAALFELIAATISLYMAITLYRQARMCPG